MKKVKILLVMFAAVFSGCGYSGSKSASNPANTTTSQQSAPLAKESVNPRGGGGGGKTEEKPESQQVSLNQAENSQTQPTAIERKIVRNAELNLETAAPEEAQQKITAIADSKSGFVVESQQSSSDVKTMTRDIITMTVRVPAAKFSETLDEIRKTASRVLVETIKSDDVTEEFIDVEARLKAKKSLEAQFLEIMKRANSVDDALNVQRQLAEVRGEIEKIEGRKRFLENQASFSTIKIRMQTPAAFSANSSGFFYQLRQSIGTGFDFALNFMLGLVTFLIAILPFVLFIVLPICLILRYLWRKWRKRKLAREIAKEEIRVE